MPGLQRLTQDGYKILKRYNDVGLEALTDCSRQGRICEKKPGIAVGPFSLCVSEELEVHATHAAGARRHAGAPGTTASPSITNCSTVGFANPISGRTQRPREPESKGVAFQRPLAGEINSE